MGLSANSHAVLASTAQLIERVQLHVLRGYADEDWAPISDEDVRMVASFSGGRVELQELGAHTQEIGIPAYTGGHAVIVVNRLIPRNFRRLAVRHGLAHLLAGELEVGQGMEVRFMSSILDYMTLEERRADVFALADLIPWRTLEALPRAPDPHAMLRYVTGEIRAFAPDWPLRRVRDRARLRLALFSAWRV